MSSSASKKKSYRSLICYPVLLAIFVLSFDNPAKAEKVPVDKNIFEIMEYFDAGQPLTQDFIENRPFWVGKRHSAGLISKQYESISETAYGYASYFFSLDSRPNRLRVKSQVEPKYPGKEGSVIQRDPKVFNPVQYISLVPYSFSDMLQINYGMGAEPSFIDLALFRQIESNTEITIKNETIRTAQPMIVAEFVYLTDPNYKGRSTDFKSHTSTDTLKQIYERIVDYRGTFGMPELPAYAIAYELLTPAKAEQELGLIAKLKLKNLAKKQPEEEKTESSQVVSGEQSAQ